MAGRYICPVCDRRLKTKHFCTYCKSFVKEPVYYTGPVANESYDSAGRPDCMADQHYGLGHVHHPGDMQREYGHHKAGTRARQNLSARQSTYVQGTRSAQQSVRSGQRAGSGGKSARGQAAESSNYGSRPNPAQSACSRQSGGQPQIEGVSRRLKKFFTVFWVFILIVVLVEVVFSLIGYQSMGMRGEAVSIMPFSFVAQFFNMIIQVGIWGLIIWAIVRKTRRK